MDNGEKEGKGVPRPHVEPIRPYKTSAPVTLQDSTDNQLTDVHTKKGHSNGMCVESIRYKPLTLWWPKQN